MAMQKTNLVISRFNFAVNKLPVMVYGIFGSILVVLINQIILNLQKLSILCFVGIEMPSNVMLIYWMYPVLFMTTIKLPILGSRNFRKVDGLLGVGPFKSLLPQI